MSTPPPAPETGQMELVRFRIRDVWLPHANELLDAIWGGRVLEGKVVARSRADEDGDCVVVKVADVDQLIVVSTTSLLHG